MTDEDRFSRGLEFARMLLADTPRQQRLPDPMWRYTIAHLFGDVWQGPELSYAERSMVTCAVLVATGREAEQRLHFVGAKNLGISREKLEALITHVAHYAGWPVAVSALRVLDEVWGRATPREA